MNSSRKPVPELRRKGAGLLCKKLAVSRFDWRPFVSVTFVNLKLLQKFGSPLQIRAPAQIVVKDRVD
eukprot:1156894-Pelagomonas_calceolata.AAC.1